MTSKRKPSESFIRPAPERYTRAFGQGPNQEPSQNNEDLKLVLDTLDHHFGLRYTGNIP